MNIQILSAPFASIGNDCGKIVKLLALTIAVPVLLTACALPQPVHIGDTEAQVLAARGQPTRRYQLGDEQLLEYNHGPFGQRTFMAKLNSDRKLISFEQVLNDQRFAAIKIGEATKTDVLHLIGSPSEQAFLPLPRLEVWSYPYKQYDVWNAIMHVHFDESGIVRKLVNTPDTRFNIRDGNLFGAFPW